MCVVVVLGLVLVATSAIGADKPPKPRPFWGNLTGEATFPLSDACSGVTGVPFQTVATTEGKMTHLGRTVGISTHCSTLDGSAAVGGEVTFTAANGDQVWAVYTATTVAGPPVIVQEGHFIIVGGTGRFADASGHFWSTVYVTYEGPADPSWPLRFVFAGTITY
jgi:hypothetical protein